MKKLGNLSLLAFLAVGFALVFGGCKSGVGGIIAAVEAMDQGDSGPSGGDGDTEDPDDDGNEILVFDPATYTGNAGRVVDGKDGEKYLEITPNGWVTDFGIPEVDITGKTTVKCMVYAKDEKDDVQIVVKLMNAKGQGFALPTLRPITAAPAEAEGPILFRADRWDNDTNSNVTEDVTDFKCVRLNPFIQETAGDWDALSDVTIYIGKITAVGNGGPTGPGSGDSENPSGPGDDTTGSGSGNDSGNTENPGDSGSSGGQTGGDITGPGGEDAENPSEPDEENEDTGIFIGTKKYAFADLIIRHLFYGVLNDAVDENGVLKVSVADYAKLYITPKETVDISAYTKVTITAKGDNWEVGAGEYDPQMAFEVASGIISEYEDSWGNTARSAANACGATSWTGGKNFFNGKDIEKDFKDFSIDLSSFELLNVSTGNNSCYNEPMDEADLSKITEFAINSRANKGTLYIKSIKFE